MPEKEIHETLIHSMQPSQLYINEKKLERVEEQIEERGIYSLEPIPIQVLFLNYTSQGYLILDGHTRAVALLRKGWEKCRTIYETELLNWEAYRMCIRWCIKEGIRRPSDLLDRIVDEETYQELWLDRCNRMKERLKKGRAIDPSIKPG